MIKILDEADLLQNLRNNHNPFFKDYFAFYSSWLGGITQEPYFMLVPMDDHLVTRGDGVFETMKSINHKIYLLDEHLDRFFYSASSIGLVPCFNQEKIKEIILQTLKFAADKNPNLANFMVRVFLSRGPGNFSPSPYDPVGSQFYCVITKFSQAPTEKYEQGVCIGQSAIPSKPSWLAKIKSCNYLPNVLMRKEAIDKNLDYVIGLDEHGFITESATENIILINSAGELIQPYLDFILKGTTMTRLCELAKNQGIKIKTQNISIQDLLAAQEVMMVGTSFSVLPVVQFEGKKIGLGESLGKPGKYFQLFKNFLDQDMCTQ